MNIAHLSIRHRVISWMFALLLLVGGTLSFLGLGQLEFPEFTIKSALVITSYPGASPQQVEEEVTLPLEEAIQQLAYVDHITSINGAGVSQIEVEIKDQYDKHDLPQIWDELRRKVNDHAGSLPPGSGQPLVVDDFGDVFGILLNVTGAGYEYRELEKYTDLLRRELVLLPGVKKVSVVGAPQEQVVVEVSQAKLAALGLDQTYLHNLIRSQNVVSNAGRVWVDGQRIRIHPTGEFGDLREMKQLLVSPPGSDHLVYLGDIARIYKTDEESPRQLYHSNGMPALSLGIAFASGVNVVEVSQAIEAKLATMEAARPIGMEINTVYNQGKVVESSVQGFLINLVESILIVIGVLLVFMGLRSGLLMGAILLLTILGTFIVMKVLDIQLQLISLGALIIALGMLVDNAIVVTEGILIGMQRGQSRLEAAGQVVKQTQWPLFGATVIAIIAFAPIGLSDNGVGEFCGDLFKVLLISLFISWITALTLTPFFCSLLFKDGQGGTEETQPYQGVFFTLYKGTLALAMHFRKTTLTLVVFALALSILGFGQVKNVFFPASSTPIFFVDVWLPEGSDIRATEALMGRIERGLLDMQARDKVGLVNVTTVMGQGIQRFVLPYTPEKSYPAYAQLVLEMSDRESLDRAMGNIGSYLRGEYPEAEFRVKHMENGPAPAAKLEARLYGEDPAELRRLAEEVKRAMRSEPAVDNIRHTWRNPSPVIRPQLAGATLRETGINKSDIDEALLINFNGKQVGTYREGSSLLPIVARAPAEERLDADSLLKLQVWSREHETFVPMGQLVSRLDTEWEDPLILRRNRMRMLAVLADPALGSGETADSVLRKVRPKVEAIPLPPGYRLEWGGDYETSREAQQSIFISLPMGFLAMFLITLLLFDSVRKPLVIWLTVPLALIGVVSGLLLFDAPLSFMAILGLLSLSGMIIKNGIVLVDQINLELSAGKAPYWAVFDSAVSRVRPVGMAAITTMLGMIPLLFDVFYSAMAVTIIFGLGFATLLTLIVLPAAYVWMFAIPSERATVD